MATQVNGASPSPKDVAAAWLGRLSSAFSTHDIDGVLGQFRTDEKMRKYLEESLPNIQITNFHLDLQAGLEPSKFSIPTLPVPGVQLVFKFETPIAHGQGLARIFPGEDGVHRALTVLFALLHLKGREESKHELGMWGEHTITWPEIRDSRRAAVQSDPHVLIVGAGQSGLNVAARFKQMGIPTIVIERHPRVGDNWRKRYPSLTLHTPRTHHCFLYQPFPETWPTFTPRDKFAAWMEGYAESQDLLVWTSSFIQTTPRYDESTRRWTVTINKDGTPITIYPKHVVIATGTLGEPVMPDVPGLRTFRGELLHASTFEGGSKYTGKRVIVFGTGNSSMDICQDLVVRGARSVTMIQRSPTVIAPIQSVLDRFSIAWPEGVPTHISDLKSAALPWHLFKRILQVTRPQALEVEKPVRETARRGGLRTAQDEPDSYGYLSLLFERFGGYWIDLGVAELAEAGKVVIKQFADISHVTDDSLVFEDGTAIEADAIIGATGYKNVRESLKSLFGSEVIDRTSEVWGMNEEGEVRGMYRDSGYPGLWYAAGDLFSARFYSKQLGIQIQAQELGYMPYQSIAADIRNAPALII